MPSIFEIYDKFKDRLSDPVVIRLHGGDRKDIEARTNNTWNEIVDSKDSELLVLTRMIQDLSNRKHQVLINVNNHYEGSAPRSIEKIKALLQTAG